MKSYRSWNCSKAFLCMVLGFVTASLGVSREVGANERVEAFLTAKTHQLNEAGEDLFYEFSDLVFRKYCSDQYHEMMGFLDDLYGGHNHFTLSDLLNQKESFKNELVGECIARKEVIDLEYQFLDYIANRVAGLIARLKEALYSSDAVSLERAEILLDDLVDIELKQNYSAHKVLDELTLGSSTRSQINLKYLQKEEGVISGNVFFESMLMTELERIAEKTDQQKKKNGCAAEGCHKKLGPYLIKCKCAGLYCSKHRHFTDHHCTFDYKAQEQERLKSTLKQVIADKLPGRI